MSARSQNVADRLLTERRYVIFDRGDDTYHAGGGEWTVDRAGAERYTFAEAEAMLEEVDAWGILRDRLRIVPG